MATVTVAALYIDPRGPYPSMPDVDCWDAERDARLYKGPHPVVAHPPCGPWSWLRKHSAADPTLALIALAQVRRWGGVLEHPAGSTLWAHERLPTPGGLPHGREWSVCVEQVRWGHVCRKRTWLFIVGAPRDIGPLPPPREPTHWASGRATPGGRGYAGGKKIASAQQRRRTPPAFARWLVDLARQVRP